MTTVNSLSNPNPKKIKPQSNDSCEPQPPRRYAMNPRHSHKPRPPLRHLNPPRVIEILDSPHHPLRILGATHAPSINNKIEQNNQTLTIEQNNKTIQNYQDISSNFCVGEQRGSEEVASGKGLEQRGMHRGGGRFGGNGGRLHRPPGIGGWGAEGIALGGRGGGSHRELQRRGQWEQIESWVRGRRANCDGGWQSEGVTSGCGSRRGLHRGSDRRGLEGKGSERRGSHRTPVVGGRWGDRGRGNMRTFQSFIASFNLFFLKK